MSIDKNTAALGFEQKIWEAADTLRGNLNAAEYEGVVFMINSADNYCMLTIDEVTYLYYTLLSINLYNLTFSVLAYYNSLSTHEKVDEIVIKPQLIQEEPELLPDIHKIPEYQESSIPDLDIY